MVMCYSSLFPFIAASTINSILGDIYQVVYLVTRMPTIFLPNRNKMKF